MLRCMRTANEEITGNLISYMSVLNPSLSSVNVPSWSRWQQVSGLPAASRHGPSGLLQRAPGGQVPRRPDGQARRRPLAVCARWPGAAAASRGGRPTAGAAPGDRPAPRLSGGLPAASRWQPNAEETIATTRARDGQSATMRARDGRRCEREIWLPSCQIPSRPERR